MDIKNIIAFLNKLEKNNNKEWFDLNRKEYEALRAEWIKYIADLIKKIGQFDRDILTLDAKASIFRINRDIRFSKNKSPYKTNFGASLNKGGKKSPFAGYYFHVDPNEVFIAGGAYMPEVNNLSAIRQEIDYHFKEFDAIVNDKISKNYFGGLGGETLSRPPKGYGFDNEAIEYIKHKSFVFIRKFSVQTLDAKNFENELINTMKAIKPLNDFINRAIGV